jgi:hypothetical protein
MSIRTLHSDLGMLQELSFRKEELPEIIMNT